jgi:hypothetical protein
LPIVRLWQKANFASSVGSPEFAVKMQSLASRAAVSGGSRAGRDRIMVPNDRALSRWTWRIKGDSTNKFRAEDHA